MTEKATFDNSKLDKRLSSVAEALKKDTMHELFVKYKFALTANMDSKDAEYKARVVSLVEEEIRKRSDKPECTGDSCPI